MTKQTRKSSDEIVQAQGVIIPEKQIEILARRLLPEIKRFFADENIRREFEEWQKARQAEKEK